MYLVDTNVISEARKGSRANRGVVSYFRATQAGERYLSVQTIGEIQRAIYNIRAGAIWTRRFGLSPGSMPSFLNTLIRYCPSTRIVLGYGAGSCRHKPATRLTSKSLQ